MSSNPMQRYLPLDRYRDLIGVLSTEKDVWDEPFWLRLAAQAAVMCPEPPAELARRIREVGEELLKHVDWYQTLASSARFVVAAMLIQHRIPVMHFVGEHARIADLMSAVGLSHKRFYEIMAVLIIMISPSHVPSSMLEIERIKAIYAQMKRFHWWLTGPEDVPACAALAQCPGPAEVVVARVEEAYQQLHEVGVPRGQRLQTAANLLPLTGLDSDRAVARYRGLIAALINQTGSSTEAHYEPLAVLTLLDHAPAIIIARFVAATKELDLFQPEEHGAANILIAADLACLDLLHCDQHQQHPILPAHAVAGMLRTLHAYHLASAVLISQAEPDQVHLIPSGISQWPYPLVTLGA